MADRKLNPAFGIVGMNRTGFSYQLDEKQYSFMMNGNLETDEQGGLSLTNEHSNLLCSRFKPGYKVIGQQFDRNFDRTYFFLTNPETKASEIGYITYFHDVEDLSDEVLQCGCDYNTILNEPLEDQIQIAGCTYTTILADDCLKPNGEINGCLNFDILHPIHKIDLKGEKYFRTLYWTDGKNPPRYLQLNNLEQYKYDGYDDCGTIICNPDLDIPNPEKIEDCVTCLDCEKLKIFKPHDIPRMYPETIQFGGNLPLGTYEFLLAYCDKTGNEITEYYSITSPITIFDENNYILNQTQLADRTNLGILLKVENLDKDFQFYKVVVIQRTDINGSTSSYVEGVHPISDTTVIYTTEQDKQIITLQQIFATKPFFKTWGGLTSANNYLFGYNFTVEKEWNLQPIANLLGGFVKWQTVQAKEQLYKDGVKNSLYTGYMRDEVYPLSLRFVTSDGYRTSNFTLVPPPPTSEDLEILSVNDPNVSSILDFVPNCAESQRIFKWQYFNTAEQEGYCTSFDIDDYETVIRETTETCRVRVEDGIDPETGQIKYTDVIKTIPSGSFTLPIDDTTFPGFKIWFRENKDLIRYCCEGTSVCYPDIPEEDCPEPPLDYPPIICDLATNTYPEYTCTNLPSPFGNNSFCEECINPDELEPLQCLLPEFIPCSEDIIIKNVENESYFLTEKIWESEYERTEQQGTCQIYIDGDGEGFRNGRLLDFDFRDGGNSEDDRVVASVYKRLSDILYNKNCQSSADLFEIQYSAISFFMDYLFQERQDGDLLENLVQENYDSIPASASIELDLPSDSCPPHTGDDRVFTNIVNHGFTNKLSKKAIWFKVRKDDLVFQNQGEEPSIIFEVTSSSELDYTEEYPYGVFEKMFINSTIRYTIYTACNGGDIYQSGTFSNSIGFWKMFTESEFDDENTDVFYIALDSPLISADLNPCLSDDPRPFGGDFSAVAPINGCFNVIKRQKEYKSAEVTFNNIQISKKESYTLTCRYIIPNLNSCNTVPYTYGKFAYWESQEEYPNNKELYDSSWLKIKPEDLPDSIVDKFYDMYASGYYSTGDFYLNKETDLTTPRSLSFTDYYNETCSKPIRHYKFPDNIVSPFIFEQPTDNSIDTIIYPIGFTIDNETINAFLDVAVNNNLISSEQRKSVVGFELYRGDRTIQKSVLYKGIANDMYRYVDSGGEWWFRNFPFNTLGENTLLNNFKGSSALLDHPFDSEGNNKFSLIAPEVYYNQPQGGTEVSIEGFQKGYSTGSFQEVEGHSRWVILGDQAKDLASYLATLEVTFETAMNTGNAMIAMATSMWSGWTAFSWGFGFAIAGHVIVLVANIASAVTFKYAKYKYEWLEIFKNNGTPYNFANYHVATGNYNFFTPNINNEDNILRGLAVGKYVKPGRAMINDEKGKKVTKVNNIQRETSFFMSFGTEHGITYPDNYINWDNYNISLENSSRYLSSDASCDTSTSTRRIGSPYMSVKNYNPTQYGTIDSIKWIPINHDGDLIKEPEGNCRSFFGGDVKITRVALKNKIPLFSVNAMKLADRTPFDYYLYPNVAYPRFYASYETPISQITQGRPIPYTDTTYVFNCREEEVTDSRDFYLKPESKFYLYYYGIPYFFVESTINNEYRYAGLEPNEQFYPNVDVQDWTQEEKNSILNNNTFFYNNTYSKDTTPNNYRILPTFYNKKEWDNLYEYPNGVVWSQQDNSEQDLRDPWLVYKPLDLYQFRTDYGQLKDLSSIESLQVLGRFENNAVVFNAVDTIADRITESTYTLGTGGIFGTRPVEFSHTELGETGTQNVSLVTTEFGHFWADAKRGKVFQLTPNAKDLIEISSFKRDGSPSGMRQWFKRHLPFKILRNKKIDNLTEQSLALDNNYNSLGLHMWWDSKFKRVFLTKKDYIVDDPCVLYNDEVGFHIDETLCNGVDPITSCPEGYILNTETGMCEINYTTDPCPNGEYNAETNECVTTIYQPPVVETTIITNIDCPEGYTYNSETQQCELTIVSPPSCPEGYNYNPSTQMCEQITISPLECPEGYEYIPEENICRGSLRDCEMDLIFVVDQSASMNDSEYTQMKNFAINMVESLQDRINNGYVKVGIVKFSSMVQGNLPLQSNYSNIIDYFNIPRTIAGQTNLVDAICRVDSNFTSNGRVGVNKKVIILTDGTQFLNVNPLTCNTYSNDDDGVLNVTQTLKNNHNPQIGLIIVGDTTERNEIKTAYVNGSSSNPNFPLPTSGNGISSLYAYEAEFTNLNNIIDEVLQELTVCDTIVEVPRECSDGCTQEEENCVCLLQQEPNCPDDICNILNDECVCLYTSAPTITQETIYTYLCSEGYIYNPETQQCEMLITTQGCSEDCDVIEEQCNCVEEVEPSVNHILTPVNLQDFEEVSFTLAYSPIYDSWVSYYSFHPDYAVAYNDFFQTGINNSNSLLKQGIWSHLLTNKSFQVFYGEKYPWMIEVPFKNEYVPKVLESISIASSTYRYQNQYDWSETRNKSFNKAVIYNNTNNSAQLHIDYSDRLVDGKYPINIDSTNQRIKATHAKGYVHFNYIYNRVKDQDNGIPIWNWDKCEIVKTLNPQAIGFGTKKVLERLRGEMYSLLLTQDKSSQYKQIYKVGFSKEKPEKI